MTQDERWTLKYNEVVEFIQSNHRNPSKYVAEERNMVNFLKHTRNWGSTKTPLSRFFYNLRRDMYLATHYPHEALWQPFFSLWLYAWRFSNGLLKDRGE